MGVFVPVTDGVQAEIVYVLDGEVCTSRLWFTYDTPPFDYAALVGLADGLHAFWASEIMPLLAHELILYQTRVSDWTTDPPGLVADHFGAVQGGNLNGSHSANVAAVVPFKWPLGFRQKRNKHYVPGVPLDQVSLNTLSTTFTDALFFAYGDLIDATRFDFYPTLTWRWRVASAYENGVPRSEQFVRSSQGSIRNRIILGQRRRRLPQ